MECKGAKMNSYPERRNTNLGRFETPAPQNEILYGLPREIKFCKICVISNQRPNSAVEYTHTKDTKKKTISFDNEGICDACLFAQKKHKVINWEDRENELRELCDRHRKTDGSYDCVVPG